MVFFYSTLTYKVMEAPQVVRIRRRGGQVVQDCDLYIGRAQNQGGWSLPASIWQNPFKVGRDRGADIHQVCARYYWYIKQHPELSQQLSELSGKRLGCWCNIVENPDRDPLERLNRPQCHGEVLVRLWWDWQSQ